MTDEPCATPLSQPEGPVAPAPSEPRRKIAVVGEIPFCGRALVQALHAAGLSTRVLCPDEDAAEAVREAAGPDTAECIEGDLSSSSAAEKTLQEVYGVIFLSPVSPLSGRLYRPATHLEDVRCVIDAAQKAALRKVVYHSALAAHTASRSEALRQAQAAETLLKECRCEDFSVRTGPLMGPQDGFLTEILKQAGQGAPMMSVMGYGSTLVQPVHIRDMALSFTRFFTHDLQPGTYFVGGPETVTLLDLVDHALARSGKLKLKVHAPLFVLRLLASLKKGSLFEERVNLLFDDFCSDKNDAGLLSESGHAWITPRQTEDDLLAKA